VKKKRVIDESSRGSLLFWVPVEGDEPNTHAALGYLMYFGGHGVYEPQAGLVDVSPEDSERHNELLDEALLQGLDEQCEVGQYGLFYWDRSERRVHTFTGAVVAERSDVACRGNTVTFRRNGKTFRGRLRKEADAFNFRRIS